MPVGSDGASAAEGAEDAFAAAVPALLAGGNENCSDVMRPGAADLLAAAAAARICASASCGGTVGAAVAVDADDVEADSQQQRPGVLQHLKPSKQQHLSPPLHAQISPWSELLSMRLPPDGDLRSLVSTLAVDDVLGAVVVGCFSVLLHPSASPM